MTTKSTRFESLAIDTIEPNPLNPRDTAEWDQLGPLAASIAAMDGIIQPLIVRENPDAGGKPYVLICGERRFRAAQQAKCREVDCIVREGIDDIEALELLLTENLHRKNFGPLQTAAVLRQLCLPREEGGAGYKHEQAAARFGKSRFWATNLIRLLKLPASLKAKVASGELTQSAARSLIPHIDNAELLARFEKDLEQHPAFYATRKSFARNLELLINQPAEPSEPTKPLKRAAPAPRLSPSASGPKQTAAMKPASPAAAAVDRRQAAGDDAPAAPIESPLARHIAELVEGLETDGDIELVAQAIDEQRIKVNRRCRCGCGKRIPLNTKSFYASTSCKTRARRAS